MRTKQQSNPILKGSLPTFLRTFFGIVIVIFFNISITHGETIIGFNWGDGEAVKKALESAAQDSELYKPGFKAGPRFWKSLIAAQSDADHGAGDGFYFSINPWDSARFGPSLLIVELHFPSDQKSKLVLSTTAEYGASTPPSQLPPVLRYKGSWHVVKALPPKTSELTVYIREASGADAQMIFDHFNLKNNFVGSIEFIQGLMQRENALFGLEGRRSIKGERQGRLKKENKATKKYLNNLMALLFDEGLKVDSKKILTEVEKSRRSQSLDAVLRQLENPEQWHHVFGLNLENFL